MVELFLVFKKNALCRVGGVAVRVRTLVGAVSRVNSEVGLEDPFLVEGLLT